MSRTDSTIAPKDTTASPEQVRQALLNRHVCPYCGHQSTGGTEACTHCTMEDSPATRQATKARIGPWYVLQNRNPSAPGMKFGTLVSLLRKGYITPRSVVRGPTTHQLWRFAANVRGVSREFGLCYSCGASIIKTASFCPSCQRPQEPPAEPDVLLEPRHNGHGHGHGSSSSTSNGNTQPKPQPPVIEPVAVPVHAPVVESAPQNAIEPVSSGSYARRLRELNRRKELRDDVRQANLPARKSTQPVFSGDARTVSAMSLVQALRNDPPKEMLVPSRKRLKALAAVTAVVILGGAALFYFRPDYRNNSVKWSQEMWATLRQKVGTMDLPRVTTSPPPRETPTALQPRRTPVPQPLPEAELQRIAAIEAPVSQPAIAVAQPSPTPATENPAQAPVAVAEPKPEVPARDSEAIVTEVRTLWSQALDAEARQDFASAVKLYEQIRQHPNDVWPGGLQFYLDQAKKRMQSTSAQ